MKEKFGYRQISSFQELTKSARLRLLKMHYEAGVGHIGGNLSALDSMLFLHHAVMCPDDVFVLSKGHAVGALYTTLWTLGVLSDEDLETFHGENSVLPGHPPINTIPEVKIATGSLGHGFPVASGMSLARKLKAVPGKVFCLCSDGEWQEGSNWEALIFARHHDLSNLVLLVDVNGLQGYGRTGEVASMAKLNRYFDAFDMNVVELNGHSSESLEQLLSVQGDDRMVYLLNTIKGKGVSFMENKLEWHYLSLSAELYEKAVKEQET